MKKIDSIDIAVARQLHDTSDVQVTLWSCDLVRSNNMITFAELFRAMLKYKKELADTIKDEFIKDKPSIALLVVLMNAYRDEGHTAYEYEALHLLINHDGFITFVFLIAVRSEGR